MVQVSEDQTSGQTTEVTNAGSAALTCSTAEANTCKKKIEFFEDATMDPLE